MDQDAFRKLLASGQVQRPQTSSQRGSFLPAKAKSQPKVVDGPTTGFKPRKIKTATTSTYRDRALERRDGPANDFAEPNLLEGQQDLDANKEAPSDRKRFPEGDAETTIPVKGLDFALLEQTRAKATAETGLEDDDALEAAFHGADPASPPPIASPKPSDAKKRTREEIVQELKSKRSRKDVSSGGAAPPVTDSAPKNDKFKPIGFKPVGSISKAKDGKIIKKKKSRPKTDVKHGLNENELTASKTSSAAGGIPKDQTVKAKSDPSSHPGQVPQTADHGTLGDDFDIFADAGDYEGVNFDDDDEDLTQRHEGAESSASTSESKPMEAPAEPTVLRQNWFNDNQTDEDVDVSDIAMPFIPGSTDDKHDGSPLRDKDAQGAPHQKQNNEETDDSATAIRIAPLMSSTVPSIRDILAADAALDAEDKRKARKEKRKAGGGMDGSEGHSGKKKVSAETKLNREYQRLKSYTDKKKSS